MVKYYFILKEEYQRRDVFGISTVSGDYAYLKHFIHQKYQNEREKILLILDVDDESLLNESVDNELWQYFNAINGNQILLIFHSYSDCITDIINNIPTNTFVKGKIFYSFKLINGIEVNQYEKEILRYFFYSIANTIDFSGIIAAEILLPDKLFQLSEKINSTYQTTLKEKSSDLNIKFNLINDSFTHKIDIKDPILNPFSFDINNSEKLIIDDQKTDELINKFLIDDGKEQEIINDLKVKLEFQKRELINEIGITLSTKGAIKQNSILDEKRTEVFAKIKTLISLLRKPGYFSGKKEENKKTMICELKKEVVKVNEELNEYNLIYKNFFKFIVEKQVYTIISLFIFAGLFLSMLFIIEMSLEGSLYTSFLLSSSFIIFVWYLSRNKKIKRIKELCDDSYCTLKDKAKVIESSFINEIWEHNKILQNLKLFYVFEQYLNCSINLLNLVVSNLPAYIYENNVTGNSLFSYISSKVSSNDSIRCERRLGYDFDEDEMYEFFKECNSTLFSIKLDEVIPGSDGYKKIDRFFNSPDNNIYWNSTENLKIRKTFIFHPQGSLNSVTLPTGVVPIIIDFSFQLIALIAVYEYEG